jgi:hypothetical protein
MTYDFKQAIKEENIARAQFAMNIDANSRDSNKSGGEIRENPLLLAQYRYFIITAMGMPEKKISREVYDILEDNNYHLLNETLEFFCYYMDK